MLFFPGKGDTKRYRSNSLIEVSKEIENSVRIDYVDEKGKITFADDKQYATMIRTRYDHTVLEQYYDAEGKPAKQSNGSYSLLREYDENGREYKITYNGIDGKPSMMLLGYSFLLRDFDEKGRTKKECYYDMNGIPVKTPYFAYGYIMKYDDNGRNTSIIYINQQSAPMISGQGYAIVQKSYYNSGNNIGKIKEEFYYDEQNMPISLELGQYGVHKEYDEYGRCNKLTYLNEFGEPIINAKGYAVVKRTFYEDDTICSELYFDIYNKPVKLSEGQYGQIKQDGKLIYTDANGNAIFNLKNFLHANHSFVFLFSYIIILISTKCYHNINYILFLLYCCFLIYMTLLFRDSSKQNKMISLFDSYANLFYEKTAYNDIINNILLFVPFSYIFYQLLPKKGIIIISVLLSLTIELYQYIQGIGICAIDDVLSNCIGTIIGYFIGKRIKSEQIVYM